MVFPGDNETRSSVYSSYTLHTRGPKCQCDHEPLAIHRRYTTLPTYTPTGLLHRFATETLLNQLTQVNDIHMFGHHTYTLFISLMSLLLVYM